MEISVKIKGISPLMFCRFSDEAALDATNGTRSSSAARERKTPMEEAKSFLYLDESEKLIVPQPMLLRCIVDGGTFHKNGKSKITTQKSSLLYSCVSITESVIPIQSKGSWQIDTRPVRIPATGGRILRHRPLFQDWALQFTIELDESVISPSLLRKIVDDAGSKIGLGAFRPACKGPYGRFRCDGWKERKSLSVAA